MEEIVYKDVVEVAEKIRKAIVHENGKYRLANPFGDNPINSIVLDTIRDIQMDVNSKYEYVSDMAADLCDCTCTDEDTMDEIRDGIGEWATADTYIGTSDLTEWLNRSPENVYYLDEAVEDGGADGGFGLLQVAQYKAREEVYTALLDRIEEFIKYDK